MASSLEAMNLMHIFVLMPELESCGLTGQRLGRCCDHYLMTFFLMMVTNTVSEDQTDTEERKTDSDSGLILLVVLQASYLDLAEMIVMMDHSRLTHLLGDALALEIGGSCFEQI